MIIITMETETDKNSWWIHCTKKCQKIHASLQWVHYLWTKRGYNWSRKWDKEKFVSAVVVEFINAPSDTWHLI